MESPDQDTIIQLLGVMITFIFIYTEEIVQYFGKYAY